MKVNPIKTLITKPITFGESHRNNIVSSTGLLYTHNCNKLYFEKNLKLAKKIDSAKSKPVKPIAQWIAKTYKTLVSPSQTDNYVHIPYYFVA